MFSWSRFFYEPKPTRTGRGVLHNLTFDPSDYANISHRE